jgi:hypothetical protein
VAGKIRKSFFKIANEMAKENKNHSSIGRLTYYNFLSKFNDRLSLGLNYREKKSDSRENKQKQIF